MAAARDAVTGNDRARDMAQRVAQTAKRHGLSTADCKVIASVLGTAMDVRAATLRDDHDPAYLHPGRTALILLEDAEVRAGVIVAAGCALESVQPGLRVSEELLPAAVREVIARIPVPGETGEELLERLLGADADVQLVALAERLDHARHLHLKPQGEWRTFHTAAMEIYLPLAVRAHPTLERRFRWWCDMFERRFLNTAVP